MTNEAEEYIIALGIMMFVMCFAACLIGMWAGSDSKGEIKKLKAQLAVKERYIQEMHREINQNKGST